jgi:sulfonate transport system substrate-binding protein
MQTRRNTLIALVGVPILLSSVFPSSAQKAREVRIGYQKNGILAIARQRGTLEARLAPQGASVKWIEFTAGPPLLEAMNIGSVDFGYTGDAPPIFAQAAGAAIVYVAGQAVTTGQGIIVKADSPIKTLADLKGKRVAFHKGSSAHNVTIAALESAGLAWADITPIYLSPADAAAAFARDSIDAWAIWDPFLAIAEAKNKTRLLADGDKVADSNSFYLANRDFAAKEPALVRQVIDGLAEVGTWAESNRDQVGKTLAEITGVDLAAQTVAANRATFKIGQVDEAIIKKQQGIADRFYKLGLIPKAISIREAVVTVPQT